MSTFNELECVTLRSARAGIPAGALGTVVLVGAEDTYLVEFADDNGETLATLDLDATDLAPV